MSTADSSLINTRGVSAGTVGLSLEPDVSAPDWKALDQRLRSIDGSIRHGSAKPQAPENPASFLVRAACAENRKKISDARFSVLTPTAPQTALTPYIRHTVDFSSATIFGETDTTLIPSTRVEEFHLHVQRTRGAPCGCDELLRAASRSMA